MLGEGVDEAEALAEGVMHGPGPILACYLNTMLAPTREWRSPRSYAKIEAIPLLVQLGALAHIPSSPGGLCNSAKSPITFPANRPASCRKDELA
jgi:hypothetical protein